MPGAQGIPPFSERAIAVHGARVRPSLAAHGSEKGGIPYVLANSEWLVEESGYAAAALSGSQQRADVVSGKRAFVGAALAAKLFCQPHSRSRPLPQKQLGDWQKPKSPTDAYPY